jgi:hypothetical protein
MYLEEGHLLAKPITILVDAIGHPGTGTVHLSLSRMEVRSLPPVPVELHIGSG